MTRTTVAAIAVFLCTLYSTPSDARHHRYHHRYHGGGLICGAVQMAHYGIRDNKFRLARHWATLPHTSAHAGAVVVQARQGQDSAGRAGGHVSRILSVRG